MTTKIINGLLINPYDQSITPVTCANYRQMIELLQQPGAPAVRGFDSVRIDDTNFCYVDDEGLLYNQTPPLFELTCYHQPLAGRGLVIGVDWEGESQSTSLSLSQLTAMVRWSTKKFVGFYDSEGTTRHPLLGDVHTISRRALFDTTPDTSHQPLATNPQSPDTNVSTSNDKEPRK